MRCSKAVALASLLLFSSSSGVAFAQSAVQESRDGAAILVNKDVGDQRWAISYDRRTGTVTGNVFHSDGREPEYIWCSQQTVGEITPGAPDLDLSCFGNVACTQAPCLPTSWGFVADVVLPVSFFLPPTPTEPTPPPAGDLPSSPDALFEFLRSGAYADFAAESSIRPTNAPHMASVRTFLNPALEASMAAGNETHPVGAGAIKELYDGQGVLAGWAAMVKVEDSDGDRGDAWYWYEAFSVETGFPRIEGIGNGVCTGCHSTGRDFIRVPFPLE